MSTATAAPSSISSIVSTLRGPMKSKIVDFFFEFTPGTVFSSRKLHDAFGSAFRSRVSEINRENKGNFVIKNETKVKKGREVSYYWLELLN